MHCFYLMPLVCNTVLLIKHTMATAFTQQEYPNPMDNPTACGIEEPGYLCDPAHIFTQQQVLSLKSSILSVQNDTVCECEGTGSNMTSSQGYRISVAMVPRVRYTNGIYPVTSEEQQHALSLFADYLRDVSWLFGRCEEHAVIVVSAYSRKVHTSLGRRIAKVLSDACARTIMDGTYDLLLEGQFASAAETILHKYRAILQGEKCKYGWSHWYTAAIIVATGVVMVILYCAAVACNSSSHSAQKSDNEKAKSKDATPNGSPANGGPESVRRDSLLILVATEEQLSRRYSLRPESEYSPSSSRSADVKRSVSSVGDYGRRHVNRHQHNLNIDNKQSAASSSAPSSAQNINSSKRNVGRSSSSASAYGKRRNRRESTFSFVTDFRYSDGRKASSLSLDHLERDKLSRGNSTNSKRRSSLNSEEQLERTASQKNRSSPAVRASPLLLV